MRPKSIDNRSSLATLALAATLSLASPAGVLAQDAAPAPAGAPMAMDYEVSIPTITAVDSSIDEATLRAIIGGDVITHAAALETLTATSITIPELTVTFSLPPQAGGEAGTGTVTYRNIVISDVEDGVASSTSVGSVTSDFGVAGKMEFETMTTGTFDIGGILRFYGLVPSDPNARPETLYSDFALEGGRFIVGEVTCDFGTMEAAEFKARPLKLPFGELMTLAQSMEAAGGQPSPDDIAKFVSFYADLFSAFETSPMHFGGLNCLGKTERGEPLSVDIGAMEIGSFGDGRYPEVSINDLRVSAEDGVVALGSLVIKGFDIAAPMAVLESAQGAIDAKWFEDNYRRLIPAFEGLFMSDLDLDVPDSNNPGQRIKLAIGEFDLSLDDYIEGIPSEIDSHTDNLVFTLPPDSPDPQLQNLLAMGITALDLGYRISLEWDESSNSINISSLSMRGSDLASLTIAGVLGNATRDLFSASPEVAMMAAMSLTAKELQIDVEDDGLGSMIYTAIGKEQNVDEQAVRTMLAAAAQGMVIGSLGTTEQAQNLGAALIRFLGGGTVLTVNVMATSPMGITLPELMQVQTDPTSIIGKIEIDAAAE